MSIVIIGLHISVGTVKSGMGLVSFQYHFTMYEILRLVSFQYHFTIYNQGWG